MSDKNDEKSSSPCLVETSGVVSRPSGCCVLTMEEEEEGYGDNADDAGGGVPGNAHLDVIDVCSPCCKKRRIGGFGFEHKCQTWICTELTIIIRSRA